MRVTEIFHSIQGESTWAGRPCTFVRLTGCPLRCRWCDTEYAFHGGATMSLEEVLAQVERFECSLVEVTGGEPLSQKECPELLRSLCDRGYDVLLETSGAVSTESVDPRVVTILDVKCPDSGESDRNLWENLDRLRPRDEIKFVLASRRDYEWALETVQARDLSARNTVLFSPVWGELEPGTLASWILEDRARVRMQIQLHKVLYGADVAGV
jgi:7-carboxy-7-deazaguanine synthase